MSTAANNQSLDFVRLDVLEKLDSIQARLLEQDAMLGVHLSSIHKALLENEELVHILPDEKIRIYMAGMSKYKQLKLVEEATKAKAKRGGKVTEDDF